MKESDPRKWRGYLLGVWQRRQKKHPELRELYESKLIIEEGKAEGLDQYQLRDFEAIQRHVALVAVMYSLLRAAQHDPALRDKLQRQLKMELEGSAAFWRRTTQAQSLWNLALFINAGLAHGRTLHQLVASLLRAVCAAWVSQPASGSRPAFPPESTGRMGVAPDRRNDARSAHVRLPGVSVFKVQKS